MLLGLIDDVEIVATAADGAQEVERARAERPDVMLMDLRMPKLEGAEATREILASLPETRVLVLSNATVKTHVNRIFYKTGARDRAQAVGYAYEHGLAQRDRPF